MAGPRKNFPYTFYVSLIDSTNTGSFKVNPTIAAGDFKVSTGGGAFTNLATLPVVDPAGSIGVLISLSAAEMNADKNQVQAIDVAGAEWDDVLIFIDATADSEGMRIKIPSGFDERSGLTSENIKHGSAPTITPKFGVIFTDSTTAPAQSDFSRESLKGAILRVTSGVADGNRFLILGGYFFQDSDDTTHKVFGIAREKVFGIIEGGKRVIDTDWDADDGSSDLVEAAQGDGWTFIIAYSPDTYPDSADGLEIIQKQGISDNDSLLDEVVDKVFLDFDNGDDDFLGTQAKPIKTFGKANTSLPNGGTIFVIGDASAYSELLVIFNTGIRVIGLGGQRVIVANMANDVFRMVNCTLENISIINNGAGTAGDYTRCDIKFCSIVQADVFQSNVVENSILSQFLWLASDQENKLISCKITNTTAITMAQTENNFSRCFFDKDVTFTAANSKSIFIHCSFQNVVLSATVVDQIFFDGCMCKDLTITDTATEGAYVGSVLGTLINNSSNFEVTDSASSLTQQNIRDSMKLAPTAGAPATGSVDLHLDDIEALNTFLKKFKVNKKRILKQSGSFFLVIFDDNGTTEIAKMKLLNFDGTDIGELTGSKTPSQQEKTTV